MFGKIIPDSKAASPVNLPSSDPIAIPQSKSNKWSKASNPKDYYRKISGLLEDHSKSTGILRRQLMDAEKMFKSATDDYVWSDLGTSPGSGKENEEYKQQSVNLIQIATDSLKKPVRQSWEDPDQEGFEFDL